MPGQQPMNAKNMAKAHEMTANILEPLAPVNMDCSDVRWKVCKIEIQN